MGRIGTVSAIILVAVFMLASVGMISAQTTVIKVEGMSIDRLHKLGYANPNSWDNVTAGVSTIGVGTMAYLSAWQINLIGTTGDTLIVPTTMTWLLESRPTGSTAALDFTNKQFVSFKADKAGDYKVKLTVGTSSATVTISASTYIGANRSNVTTTRFNCGSCHVGLTKTLWDNWKSSPHGKKFEKRMNEGPAYWGESCFKCHTTGYNLGAANGGFDDVATTLGFVATQWTPKAGRYDSLLTTNKKEISLFGGIGCENCHGPYNTGHFSIATKSLQPKTMSAGVCAQCHDEPWRHNRYKQWAETKHGGTGSAVATRAGGFRSTGTTEVTVYSFDACVRCHDGQAFVNFTKNRSFDNRSSSGYGRARHNYITCQSCHDSHAGGLRSAPTTSDTLGTGFNYSLVNLGKGKLCVNCHKFRRGEGSYIATTNMSSHWGPHYAGAGDVLLGQNGNTFGDKLPFDMTKSVHLNVKETCVGCHMQATTDTGTVARDKVGMHSWKMKFGTTKNVGSCGDGSTCHKAEDVKTVWANFENKVEGLKKKLAMYLPPIGIDTVDRTLVPNTNLVMKQATWNYLYVKYDASHGIHNPRYVVYLLQKSLQAMGGPTEVEPLDGMIPDVFELAQNYPNPFNPSTEIRFSVPNSANVRLDVYDVTGRVVANLVSESLNAGNHRVTWNGRGFNGELVSSGVYLYRITAGSFVATKKMVLMK